MDGRWYGAVIARVREDGKYEVDWDDGDEEDRVKERRELREGRREDGRESKRQRGAEQSIPDEDEGVEEVGEGAGGGGSNDRREVCIVCQGPTRSYCLFPCGHKAVCGECADFGRFFDEGSRPVSVCGVCHVELEEPFLVRAETLSRYRIYDS